MTVLKLVTEIRASPALCFDLSRDIDLHQRSMANSAEQAINGRTTGLIEQGEQVTWRARHFGLTHHHTAKITAFERPHHFRDEMIAGRFAEFVHDHHFEASKVGTRMRDVVAFRSPFGPLGAVVDALILRGYLRRLLETRNRTIRTEAERGTESRPPANQSASDGPRASASPPALGR